MRPIQRTWPGIQSTSGSPPKTPAGNRVTLGADGDIRLSYTPTNLEAHQRLREKFMNLLDTMRCRNESTKTGDMRVAGSASVA
jgi:hypothetical protein